MSSVARHAAVSHTHFEGTLKPEGQDRIARNPYRPPARRLPRSSKDQFQTHLQVTARRGRRDRAKVTARSRNTRIVELCMVEDIESVGAEG
jgi:hypothetical protein